ncbi:GFA family protein [Rhodobacter sp. SY28-1]|uniref:GFA family protein n=1 Tax=Rhodobacter sp. SY28-1 TaxID=2562317 RepID=UPI0010C11833|nr:GFA family protein [Rhodobacter sp. SY28-1]
MEAPFTGGCACGALRYAMTGQPVEQTHCQCRDCQRRSGSGHSSWLVFAETPGAVVSGPASAWSVLAETGMEKRHAFCPICGTPVYLAFPAMPGIIAVTAASLDDPGRFAPRQVTWTRAAQAWDSLPPGLTAYAQMPPA